METIILLDGRTIKGTVTNESFNGLYWQAYYQDKLVSYHNNCWMER